MLFFIIVLHFVACETLCNFFLLSCTTHSSLVLFNYADQINFWSFSSLPTDLHVFILPTMIPEGASGFFYIHPCRLIFFRLWLLYLCSWLVYFLCWIIYNQQYAKLALLFIFPSFLDTCHYHLCRLLYLFLNLSLGSWQEWQESWWCFLCSLCRKTRDKRSLKMNLLYFWPNDPRPSKELYMIVKTF